MQNCIFIIIFLSSFASSFRLQNNLGSNSQKVSVKKTRSHTESKFHLRSTLSPSISTRSPNIVFNVKGKVLNFYGIFIATIVFAVASISFPFVFLTSVISDIIGDAKVLE
jgi:hypothetical protein